MQLKEIEPALLLQCFSDVVRERREKLGISQEELGVRAGLHRTYISDVECGARNLSLKTLCRLALALGSLPSILIRQSEAKCSPHVSHLNNVEQTEELYNTASCGFHSIDASGLIVKMNDTQLNWLGYKREEIVGKMNIRSLISEKFLHRFESEFADFRQKGYAEQVRCELVCKNGGFLPVLFNATAVNDDAGHFVMSRTCVFNISQLVNAEQSDNRLLN